MGLVFCCSQVKFLKKALETENLKQLNHFRPQVQIELEEFRQKFSHLEASSQVVCNFVKEIQELLHLSELKQKDLILEEEISEAIFQIQTSNNMLMLRQVCTI